MYPVACDTQDWNSAERERKAGQRWKEKRNSAYFSFDRKEESQMGKKKKEKKGWKNPFLQEILWITEKMGLFTSGVRVILLKKSQSRERQEKTVAYISIPYKDSKKSRQIKNIDESIKKLYALIL